MNVEATFPLAELHYVVSLLTAYLKNSLDPYSGWILIKFDNTNIVFLAFGVCL